MFKLTARNVEILSVLLIIAGLILPYVGLGNEFTGRDEAYQALCVMNYAECPLAMLSFYVGNQWIRLFGNEIISLRCLMVVCYQVSISISCGYLYYRKHNILLTATVFLTMCVGFRYVAMSLYGWDSGAYPSMTLFAVMMLLYISKPSKINIVLVGCAMGIMVMSRIPTLAALPFAFFVIIFNNKRLHNCVEWEGVIKDSCVGLLSLFVTIGCIVLIITSGNIDEYFEAWSTKNIINGHFDPDFVLWRWKDVSRRVLTAFYPMITCFACACYMIRVKRYYWFNYSICLLLCCVLSFYFLKTYMMYFEYASGIYESLLGILVIMPFLYNMTHDKEAKIELLPMISILFCSLLAGIGSDGFLERPMTVNAIPLICAYVYNDKSKNVIRQFFIFALMSGMVMYMLFLISNFKGIKYEYDGIAHLSGIKSNSSGGDVVERFNEVSSVIDCLKSDGSDFSVVGTDRYEFDYVYRNGVSYNLHHFHYFDGDEDVEAIKSIVGRYKFIILLKKLNGEIYSRTRAYLHENGYSIKEQGVYFDLFARE